LYKSISIEFKHTLKVYHILSNCQVISQRKNIKNSPFLKLVRFVLPVKLLQKKTYGLFEWN